MRSWLLAAVAAAAIASPALARDQSQYVGIEGGILFDGDLEQDLRIDDGDTIFDYDDAFEIDLKPGFDVDAIVGYDYGMFRLEAEAGFKSLRADQVEVDEGLLDEID
ncbi:MAG: hypothetical protein M3Q57_05445, partial [Pseudomonadota bacterium]|nr:hypothetical protein [Pseudomonadota bacterium]